jgi:hypothetical protein
MHPCTLCLACRSTPCSILLFKAFVDLCRGVSGTTASLAATTAEARQSAGQLDPMLRQMTVPKQFYHSKTGMPILPNEVDCDSDDDVDESWITNQSDRVRVSVRGGGEEKNHCSVGHLLHWCVCAVCVLARMFVRMLVHIVL